MGILQIEEAQREGARLVVGLAGISGSGKTFSALQLAYGLANFNAKKIGLLCTENKRDRLYSDAIKNDKGEVQRFLVGDLYAPFSPERYCDAIQEFADAGVEVLVIDSVSHEWNGPGGCEDIAHQAGAKVAKWNDAKREHKRFMNKMLTAPLHVIACMRAQEKTKMEVVNGKTTYTPMGILPICEKNFTFELTASMMVHAGGQQREILKCPQELAGIFGTAGEWAEGYLTPQHGKALRDWVDGGVQVDPAIQAARDTLQMNADKGLKALESAWAALSPKLRKAIGPKGCPDDLKASAAAFDKLNAANDNGQGGVDALNQALAG